jgi:hypothetical protein
MQAVAWLVLCLLLSMALHRRPLALALVALSLWCLLPGISAHLVTGVTVGVFAAHPAAFLVLVAVVVRLVVAPRSIVAALAHRAEWTILLATVCVMSVLFGVLQQRGLDTLSAAIDQVVAPVALFVLFGSALIARPSGLEVVRWWFLAMAAVQSALALAQGAAVSTFVYGADYGEQYWFTDYFNRWMGTFDHPLVLSLFLVIAMYLVAGVRHWWLAVPMLALYMGGLLVTQSRVGVALGALAIPYVALSPRLRLSGKLAVLAAAVTGAGFAVSLGAAAAIQARVTNDSGSSRARADALQYFLDHIRDFAWFGQGLNASFSVSDDAGLGTSFESAVLMYSIDLGVVVTLMYFGVMVAAAARSFGARAPVGVFGPAVAAVVIPQTFSALSGSTAAPAVVWSALALSGFCALRREPSAQNARAERPQLAHW